MSRPLPPRKCRVCGEHTALAMRVSGPRASIPAKYRVYLGYCAEHEPEVRTKILEMEDAIRGIARRA